MRIRKGDNIKVISGKDRGKTAKVIKVFPKDGKILVEGVNIRKKHRRARQQDKKGEVIHLPAPVHSSNVMLVCPKCGQAARVGYKIEESGYKIRVCKKCGGEV